MNVHHGQWFFLNSWGTTTVFNDLRNGRGSTWGNHGSVPRTMVQEILPGSKNRLIVYRPGADGPSWKVVAWLVLVIWKKLTSTLHSRWCQTAAGPRAADPRAAGPRDAAPRAAGPRDAAPRAAGPKAAAPRAAGPRAAAPRAAGPRAAAPKAAGPRAAAPRAAGIYPIRNHWIYLWRIYLSSCVWFGFLNLFLLLSCRLCVSLVCGSVITIQQNIHITRYSTTCIVHWIKCINIFREYIFINV